MSDDLRWDDEAARYVRSRSARYPGGSDIEPEWCAQVLQDVDLVAFEPDPKSRMGASRFVGWSEGAGRVLVVIAYRDFDRDLHLINAWPASGADLAFHEQQDDDETKESDHGEDD